MAEFVAIAALAAGCAGWALLQRWIERRDPGNPGVVRDCGGCAQAASCRTDCRPRSS